MESLYFITLNRFITKTLKKKMSLINSILILIFCVLIYFIITKLVTKISNKTLVFNIQIISFLFGMYFYSFLCESFPVILLAIFTILILWRIISFNIHFKNEFTNFSYRVANLSQTFKKLLGYFDGCWPDGRVGFKK